MHDHQSMSPEEFRRAGYQAVDWIARYLAQPYPRVLPQVSPGELIDSLPARGPETGEPFENILADFERLILPGITHWNHPGFLAYFATSAPGPGIVGELLAAALNPNHMLWKTSPAATELEQVTLAWLRQWMSLPEDWFGLVFDTASTSTLHAIAAARELADPEARARGGAGDLVLYTSEQAHSSVEKGAITLGIGQRNVRKIGVDREFRMRPDLLAAAIERDRSGGLRPFCVVATAGTTSTTSIDPLEEVAGIAARHGLWMHVDAAYGGAAAIVPELRGLLAGAERADSLVVNPHKWLLTPLDLSVLYTRHPEILRRAFSLVPDYLRTVDDPRAVNFMEYGVPLGRRFRALKLWFVMRSYGRQGLAEMIRRHVAWARELAGRIEADPDFELAAPAPLSLVCFRCRGGDRDNQRLLERVNATGEVFLSHTVLDGRFTLRLAIGNFRTSREQVLRAWEIVQHRR
ncbi:MAG: amino acid decarboxylase [Acidobacteria bacterium]|nr:amino acid decarboxylase [Acidobacteriota bacterium]